MAKRKLSPPTQELVVNQGDDFIFQLVIKDSDNKPVDITGFSYICKVREDAESDIVLAEAECTLYAPAKGIVEINFTSDVTSQIDTDGSYYGELASFYYDVLQIDAEGKRERILQGPFLVSPGISYH